MRIQGGIGLLLLMLSACAGSPRVGPPLGGAAWRERAPVRTEGLVCWCAEEAPPTRELGIVRAALARFEAVTGEDPGAGVILVVGVDDQPWLDGPAAAVARRLAGWHAEAAGLPEVPARAGALDLAPWAADPVPLGAALASGLTAESGLPPRWWGEVAWAVRWPSRDERARIAAAVLAARVGAGAANGVDRQVLAFDMPAAKRELQKLLEAQSRTRLFEVWAAAATPDAEQAARWVAACSG